MTDLDKKLADVFNDNYESYPESHLDYGECIRQIKQVFLDDGWHKSKPVAEKIVPTREAYKQLKEVHESRISELKTSPLCMTGQEWYDRFERNLQGKPIYHTNQSEYDVNNCMNMMLRAAKKAAGIEQ